MDKEGVFTCYFSKDFFQQFQISANYEVFQTHEP